MTYLIEEAANSELLRKTIEAQADMVEADAATIESHIEAMLDVETARGVWLDLIGARVGIRRLWIVNEEVESFGFKGVTSARGFLQAPFRSIKPTGEFIGISDETFRLFIKSRGILNIGDGTAYTFEKAVKIIDPGSSVIDNRDMSITIYTDRKPLFDLAEKSNALPRSAGIEVNYVERDVFGFKGAGTGFDQGGFRS